MADTIVNAAVFQVVWIACVGGGGAGIWWLGPLAVVLFGLWQIPRSGFRHGDLSLMLVAAPIGMAVDSVLIAAGLLSYPAPGPWGSAVAPIWILALWMGFALTLNHSLAWLKGKPIVAAVVGGIAGPFSYWIGATTWRAVDFVAPTSLVLSALAIIWAVATPGLVWMAERLNARGRYAPAEAGVLEGRP